MGNGEWIRKDHQRSRMAACKLRDSTNLGPVSKHHIADSVGLERKLLHASGRSLAMKCVLLLALAAGTTAAFAVARAGNSPDGATQPASRGTTQVAARTGETVRTWVDSTGRFQTRATLIDHDRQSVTLRRADGIVVRVPNHRLSLPDRRLVERLNAQTPGAVLLTARAIGAAASAIANSGSMIRQLANGTAVERPTVRSPQTLAHSTPNKPASAEIPADIVYVHVSSRTLRRLVRRPLARQSVVQESIVGTPVSGRAQTTGMLDLRLTPSAGNAVIDLLMHGQVHSQTTGHGGPVRVHSSGVTNFAATKRLVFEDQGYWVFPARTSARTSTSIQGVSTHLPRLRGRIARRIGSRRAIQMLPAADAEASQKAAARIARQFDRDVDQQLVGAHGKIYSSLAALPLEPDLLRGYLRFATTANYLHLAVNRGQGRLSPVRPPVPSAYGSPDLAIHVHRSVVEHVARNTELQRLLLPLVNSLLADDRQGYLSRISSAAGADVRQSTDGQWWSLVLNDIAAH